MYKNYVKDSLTINEYNAKNSSAPDGQQYCNAFCQQYMNIDHFYASKADCKLCYNQILKARQMIDNGQLTAEQFKENPSIIERTKTIIPMYRICITCNDNKTLDQFEATRKECIPCRRQRAKISNTKKFAESIIAIDEIKSDIVALTTLLKSISKDIIVMVMSHYKISRSHPDNKDQLMVKVIDHFKALLNPFICLGTCGITLNSQFSVCDVCKNKPKKSAEEIMVNFENKLDELMENLESMKKEESSKYNKKQIIMIAKRLGIKFYQTMDKPVIMELIDKHFEDKNLKEVNAIKEQLGGEINLNGVTVLARDSDGFINATALCKAGGKLFANWFRLDSTKELIKCLEDEIQVGHSKNDNLNIHNHVLEIIIDNVKMNPTLKLIDVKKGGNHSGSWIHPDLAVQLAQWLSPTFALKVSKWIREIALTGRVVIGDEKNSEELIQLQKDYKKLDDKHRKLLKKKTYHKFNQGACFYIISDIDGKSMKFKPGFEGVDIDVRMAQHRSTMPGCKLEYLIYSDDADLVEKAVLKRFESKRKFANHEWIYDVNVDFIIRNTRTILDVIGIVYTEEKNIEEYNNQIKGDFETE